MIRKIKLYGALRKLSGVKEFDANVSNVDQVYSYIKVNYPQLFLFKISSYYHFFLLIDQELLKPLDLDLKLYLS